MTDQLDQDTLTRVSQTLKEHESPDATFFEHQTRPLIFARATASTVIDIEGKSFIDLCAGFGALALGHNPKEHRSIWQNLSESDCPPVIHAMGDLYPAVSKATLIKLLLSILPEHFKRVSLALSGSQAVEIAMKTSLLATGKSGFIAFEGGYHGLDIGALNLTHREMFRQPFLSWLKPEQVIFLPFAKSPEDLKNAFAKAIHEFQRRGIGFSAAIVEPVQGRGGVRIASVEWLSELRRCCDQFEGLLIFDEIFCGLGRSGQISSAFQIKADLSCFGKALGGGLPLSACAGTDEVMRAWPVNSGEALHTGTFFGHPLACELGAATLRSIHAQNLVKRAHTLGIDAQKFLRDSLEKNNLVTSVRGAGLMIGIETKIDFAGVELTRLLREKGVIVLPCGEKARCLSITPALNISEEIFFAALHTIVDGINEYTRLPRV